MKKVKIVPNLNNVRFFKPVAGRTLRAQLKGKKLVGPEVVDYLRSLIRAKTFVPPAHWEKPLGQYGFYGFSLTYVTCHKMDKNCHYVNGFVWSEIGFGPHYRSFMKADPLDMMVGDDLKAEWATQDWVLIEV